MFSLFSGLQAQQKRPRAAAAAESALSKAGSQPEEEGVGRGGWGLGAGWAHAAKRRRTEGPAADCESHCDTLLVDNPLFEDDEEASYGSFDDQENAPLKTAAAAAPPAAATAASSDDNPSFDDFSCTPQLDSPAALLDGFLRTAFSTPVLSALTALERLGLHPVGADSFATLECTCAAMLVLCRRCCLAPEELEPELMLTLLWVLQATGSQYLANLDYSLQTFLALHPDRHSLLGSPALRANILALQLSLLQRSDWRMLLLDDAELRQALGDLQQQPSFAELCRFVLGCARSGATPLGTHGHSPKAALRYGGQGAAAAPRPQQRSALGSAESNSARSCAGDSAPSDAGGWQPAANAAAPARQHRGALPLQPANRR